jgi:hypothetical protein
MNRQRPRYERGAEVCGNPEPCSYYRIVTITDAGVHIEEPMGPILKVCPRQQSDLECDVFQGTKIKASPPD